MQGICTEERLGLAFLDHYAILFVYIALPEEKDAPKPIRLKGKTPPARPEEKKNRTGRAYSPSLSRSSLRKVTLWLHNIYFALTLCCSAHFAANSSELPVFNFKKNE